MFVIGNNQTSRFSATAAMRTTNIRRRSRIRCTGLSDDRPRALHSRECCPTFVERDHAHFDLKEASARSCKRRTQIRDFFKTGFKERTRNSHYEIKEKAKLFLCATQACPEKVWRAAHERRPREVFVPQQTFRITSCSARGRAQCAACAQLKPNSQVSKHSS